jgi:hypothetical protein
MLPPLFVVWEDHAKTFHRTLIRDELLIEKLSGTWLARDDLGFEKFRLLTAVFQFPHSQKFLEALMDVNEHQ